MGKIWCLLVIVISFGIGGVRTGPRKSSITFQVKNYLSRNDFASVQ
jgi:hypothetical protein